MQIERFKDLRTVLHKTKPEQEQIFSPPNTTAPCHRKDSGGLKQTLGKWFFTGREVSVLKIRSWETHKLVTQLLSSSVCFMYQCYLILIPRLYFISLRYNIILSSSSLSLQLIFRVFLKQNSGIDRKWRVHSFPKLGEITAN